MYELRPESIKTFIEDTTIGLPRFQRKPTWGSIKDFDLSLSLFRGYPLGMVVIKRDESDEQGATTSRKSLLDGRQRRDALSRMRNPEEIYRWAKRALRIKNRHTPDEIRELYLSYIDDYFGSEDWEHPAPTTAEQGPNDPEEAEHAVEEDEDPAISIAGAESANVSDLHSTGDELHVHPSSDPIQFQGLKDLLDLVVLVHPLRKRSSGLTEAFDFSRHVENLEYLEKDTATGKSFISTLQLLLWISTRKRLAAISGTSFPPSEDEFFDWLLDKKEIKSTEAKLRQAISVRWNVITESFRLLELLEKRMQDSQIGYLEIRKCTANDEKKIFEIINTKGTPLTAAEILSARPAWNKEIDQPHPIVVENVLALYEEMALPLDDDTVRRWDVAATLLDRIESGFVLGQPLPFSSRNFEKKVTLGFRVSSGFYSNRISKNDIEKLADRDDIPWGTLQLESAINDSLTALKSDEFFKFWLSWGTALIDLMSDAVAMNFLLVVSRDWAKKDAPSGHGVLRKNFVRNARVLLDTLIWEYCTGRWRGSGDSRITSNLNALDKDEDVREPVSEAAWKDFLTQVIDDGLIEDRSYLDEKSINAKIRLLLYYYAALRPIAPNPGKSVDVDHIIPEALFDQASDPGLKRNRHHIANLQLLALDDNRSKLDKPLSALKGDWLRQQVEMFGQIPASDFEKYSSVSQSDELIHWRGQLIKDTFLQKRKALLEV